MQYLKQSTASQSVLLGPFVDSTDGATAETGLTIANTDIRLSANGGNMFAKTSGGGTHDEEGWYTVTFDATDTATVGRLQVSCKVAGALAVWAEYQVLEEAVYDAFFGASSLGYVANAPVNVAQLSGDTGAADNAESFFDGTGYAGTNNVIPTVTNLTNLPTIPTGWLNADGIAPDAGAEIGTAVWATTTRVLTAGTNLNDFNPATDTVALVTSVGSVTGTVGSVAGNVDGSVASVTGNVGGVIAQVSADMTALSGSATAADNLKASALSILPFTATGVPTTTTIPASALGVTVDDLLIGRVVIVTSGNAQYEAARITDYDQASLTMTVTTMTTPMVAGDTGVIV